MGRAINEHERTCPDCQRVINETPMTTPTAPLTDLLAQAFREYWTDPDMENEEDPDWYARSLLATPAGQQIARQAARIVELEAALVREHRMRDPHRRADGMLDTDDCSICEVAPGTGEAG